MSVSSAGLFEALLSASLSLNITHLPPGNDCPHLQCLSLSCMADTHTKLDKNLQQSHLANATG